MAEPIMAKANNSIPFTVWVQRQAYHPIIESNAAGPSLLSMQQASLSLHQPFKILISSLSYRSSFA